MFWWCDCGVVPTHKIIFKNKFFHSAIEILIKPLIPSDKRFAPSSIVLGIQKKLTLIRESLKSIIRVYDLGIYPRILRISCIYNETYMPTRSTLYRLFTHFPPSINDPIYPQLLRFSKTPKIVQFYTVIYSWTSKPLIASDILSIMY